VPRRDVGLKAELSELVALLRAYAVQETVGPLRGLGRYLLFGLAGAIAVSVSIVLAALALVRVLQTETTVFGANWSFVPHLAGAALLVVAIVGLARAIKPSGDAPGASKHADGDAHDNHGEIDGG